MTTKRINSKGQIIEDLDVDTDNLSDIRGPFQSPKPTSPKRNNINIEKMEPINNKNSLYSLPQNQKEAIEEMIAWSEYYLNCKKNNNKLSHIFLK